MAEPVPNAVESLDGFPNLKAILAGTVSGHHTEWPMVRQELIRLLARPNSEAQAVRVEVIGHRDQPVSARCCISGCQDLPDNRPNSEASRAEIIEECVRACEWSWTHAAWNYKETVARIRSLKAEKSAPSAIEARDYKELYFDLIMQVANKYPGESRHDTAKRYIRRAEEPCDKNVAMDRGSDGKA